MPTIGYELELQGAIKAKLAADSELQGYIGSPIRLYQDVPDGPTYPYLTVGEGLSLDDSVQCVDGGELFPEIHVWSKTPGWEEGKKISAIIRNLLHNATLTLTENECKSILFRRSDSMRDPNYPIKHFIVTFAARVEDGA